MLFSHDVVTGSSFHCWGNIIHWFKLSHRLSLSFWTKKTLRNQYMIPRSFYWLERTWMEQTCAMWILKPRSDWRLYLKQPVRTLHVYNSCQPFQRQTKASNISANSILLSSVTAMNFKSPSSSFEVYFVDIYRWSVIVGGLRKRIMYRVWWFHYRHWEVVHRWWQGICWPWSASQANLLCKLCPGWGCRGPHSHACWATRTTCAGWKVRSIVLQYKYCNL